MLKYTPAINLLFGSLLVLPAASGISLQDGGLLESIEASSMALEQLGIVQRGLQQGDTRSIQDLLRMTEPPLGSGPELGERLNQLRSDVGQLQQRVDRAAAGSETAATGGSATGNIEAGGMQIQRGPGGLVINGGETQATRRAGVDASTLVDVGTRVPGTTPITPGHQPKTDFEHGEDFLADKLSMGRLLCKAGQYDKALEQLQTLNQPEAQYWTAVCLERVGRIQEAMARYEYVSGLENAGPFAETARNDLAFLRWKQEFQERRDTRLQGAGGQQ